jgi:hypothetical protein
MEQTRAKTETHSNSTTLSESTLTEAEPTPTAAAEPWNGLSVEIPTTRSPERVASFVETVLVELTHEPVGAVHHKAGVTSDDRLEVVCTDDVGETFEFRRYLARHGWDTETVSRSEAREKLTTLLSRMASPPVREREAAPVDTFSVHRRVRLQSHCLEVDG